MLEFDIVYTETINASVMFILQVRLHLKHSMIL